MRNRNLCLTILLALLLVSPALGATITGHVFFDANNDGVMNPGDKPLAGVVISDEQQVVGTSSSGEYRLQTEPGRIVSVSLPRGYRTAKSFYHTVEADASVDFPMLEWAESKSDAVRFTQITDIHVTGQTTVSTFIRDLEEINDLHPAPAFIIATGDLVNDGVKSLEYENYVRATATSKLPVFNVPGNHDVAADAGMVNYRRFLGPPNYSFNVGNCHVVVVNCLDLSEKRKAWIAKDLEAAPKGSRRIFAMHYLPTQEQMKYFGSLKAAAILSGHWHGNRVREEQGILDLNTPPLRFGGIDRTARSFRVVDVAKGKVTSELRFGGFHRHAAVVSPCGSCAPRDGKIQVVVNAYDSRCKTTAVECVIGDQRIPLKQTSAWSWMGELPASVASKSPQRLVAEVRGENGQRWSAESSFHTGSNPAGIGQLNLAAIAPTGGFIALSSPKGAGGTVAIGVSDHGDLKDCGVRLFTKGLKPKWSYRTDSAIKNNVAITDARVFAASIDGWLYSLDRNTGKPVWKVELERDRALERWEVSAATVEDGMVFVGGASYVAAFDEVFGKQVWSSSITKSDWWPSCYVVPTVAKGRLLLMTNTGAHAFNAATGERLWKLDGKFHGSAVSGDTVYTIRNNVAVAIDSATGKVLWTGKDHIGDSASSPAISGDRMVVGTADGCVRALSTTDGARLWSFQTAAALSTMQPYQREISDVNSSPAIANGVVYVGASDGLLYALSLDTGDKLSSYNLGVPIASSPLVYEGRLYVGAYDGNLYAFEL